MEISETRREYTLKNLNKNEVAGEPIKQFKIWLNEAIEAKVNEPTAMALATTSKDGKPSVRIVLLKGIHDEGFVFFTNYNSRKGKEIAKNPYGAAVFHWYELERQVRIEGIMEKVSSEESDEYFFTRPEGSKISAIVSPQSQIIPDRMYLEELVENFKQEQKKEKLKRPEYWGGYILKPNLVEFWQGRTNRLHDRIQYTKKVEGWQIVRLAP